MPRYVNVGAPFERDDGTIVETEQELDPTPRELRLYAHKLEPAEEAGALFEDPDGGDSVRWPMRMHPALYLEIYPKGPHSVAATKVLALEVKRTEALKPKRPPRRVDTAAAVSAASAIKSAK